MLDLVGATDPLGQETRPVVHQDTPALGGDGWLLTPVSVRSQLTQCGTLGLAGGSAPSSPGSEFRCLAGAVPDPPSASTFSQKIR